MPHIAPSRTLYRSLAAGALVAASVGLVVPGAGALPSSGHVAGALARVLPRATNWVLTKATTPTPAPISSRYAVSGRWTGPGPLVIGFALASRGGQHPFAWSSVRRHSGPGTVVALGVGSIEKRLRLEVTMDDHGDFSAAPVSIDFNATKVAMVAFVVNGVITDVTWWPRPTMAPVTSTIRSGSDAGALMVARPSSGVGAAAAGVGGAAGTFERLVPRGIVGAMEAVTCQVCGGSWTTPAGKQTLWSSVRHHAWAICWCGAYVAVNSGFAGPRGAWQWTWAGISAPDPAMPVLGEEDMGYLLAEPVAGAYAPIGSDWKLWNMCGQPGRCTPGL